MHFSICCSEGKNRFRFIFFDKLGPRQREPCKSPSYTCIERGRDRKDEAIVLQKAHVAVLCNLTRRERARESRPQFAAGTATAP